MDCLDGAALTRLLHAMESHMAGFVGESLLSFLPTTLFLLPLHPFSTEMVDVFYVVIEK